MKPKICENGDSFGGLLVYTEDGRKHEHVIKDAITVSTNMAGRTNRELTVEFEAIRRLRPDIKRPVAHHVLSLPLGEKLTPERWDALVRDYLVGMGINPDKHQFVARMHADTDYQHVHIIVNRISLASKVWHGERSALRAIELCQKLEVKHELIQTDGLDPDKLDRAMSQGEYREAKRTGQDPKRLQLAAIIRDARASSSSFPELIRKLEAKGISLTPNGKSGTVSGVSYKFSGQVYAGAKVAKDCAWKALSDAVNYDAGADARLVSKLRQAREIDVESTETAVDARKRDNLFDSVCNLAIHELYGKQSVITRQRYDKVLAEIRKQVPRQAEAVDAALEPQLISLRMNASGIEVFTSKAILQREEKMIRGARMLASDTHHDLSSAEIEQAIALKETEASQRSGAVVTMTEEQRAAVRHGFRGGYTNIQGSAGAGKSFSMECLRIGYEARGYSVYGTAINKKAAEGIGQEAGIAAFTLAKLLNDVRSGAIKLDAKSLVILDEAGQVDAASFAELIEHCESAGAKLVSTGEDKQLDAIIHGGTLRMLSMEEVVGTARVETILRQNEAWVRAAVADYRDGEMASGLEAFESRGLVHMIDGEKATQAALVDAWLRFETQNPSKASLILAHSNADARALGERVREIRKTQGRVTGPEFTLTGTHSNKSYQLTLAAGDRIKFGLNAEEGIGAINGTLGYVVSIKPVRDADGNVVDHQLQVATDDRGVIEFRTSEYCNEKGQTYLSQAYALNVYNSQGMTVHGDVFVYQTPMMGRALTYVANSRAKGDTHTFANTRGLSKQAGSMEPGALRKALLDNMSADHSERLATEILIANDPDHFRKTYGDEVDPELRSARDHAMAEQLAELESDDEEPLPQLESYEEAMAFAKTEVFGRSAVATLDRFKDSMVELGQRAPEFAERVQADLQAMLVECSREGGRELYTTAEILAREHRMIREVRAMASDVHHDFSSDAIDAAILAKETEASQRSGKEWKMTDEQRVAVAHAFRGGFASIQGSAGAGKTAISEALKLGHEARGDKVYGAAISTKVAGALQAETGIRSYTVAKMLSQIQRGQLVLDHRTCIVVDESGQVGTGQLAALVSGCHAAGAKIVFTGEDRQLDAVQHGGALRFLSRDDVVGTARVQTIQRQDEAWAKQAVADYRDGRMHEGLKAFEERGLVVFKRGGAEATQDALIAKWRQFELASREAHAADPSQPQKQALIVAHSNATARELGEKVRAIRRGEGVVTGPDYKVKAAHGEKTYELTLAQGDRIRFNQNDERGLGVINGTLGAILSIHPTKNSAGKDDYAIRVDTDDRGEVSFLASEYLNEQGRLQLSQAYCLTVYSSQGTTVHGDVFALQSGGMDRAHTYVANSRAKGDTHTFVDRDALVASARSEDDEVLRNTLLAQMGRENSQLLATEHMAGADEGYVADTFGENIPDEVRLARFASLAEDDAIRARFKAEADSKRLSNFPAEEAIRARFAAEEDAKREAVHIAKTGGPRGSAMNMAVDKDGWLTEPQAPLQRPGAMEPARGSADSGRQRGPR